MRKLFVVIFLTLIGFSILVVGSYYIINKKLNVNPKVINELRKDPKRNISELLPQGKDLESPLVVKNGLRLALFADLKEYGTPRVLKFDGNGVLFASLTSEGKVVALKDNNNDGHADDIVVVKEGLNKPHGLAFYKDKLYIAESDKVVVYNYDLNSLTVSEPEIIINLPNGGRHFTRTINIHDDKLYTSVGSSCDVCIEESDKRASILVSDLNGENLRVYADGLRNTVFFTIDGKGQIWGNDMGRDFLGDNLPPDELNIIEDGKHYGWPRCYGNQVRDHKFRSWEALNFCNETESSYYDYPAHVAPLGLTFIHSQLFDSTDQGDILASFHGSWNSTTPVGYKIVKLDLNEKGEVMGMEDFITGWLQSDNEILGRPVDLIFDDMGLLYISDDRASVIYILTKENNI